MPQVFPEVPAPLGDNQFCFASVTPTDKVGNIAKYDTINWTSDDPTICVVTPDADPLRCKFDAQGKLGETVVHALVDANNDPGIEDILDQPFRVTVTAQGAVTMSAVVEPAQEKP